MKLTVDEIKAAIPHLDPSDLKDIRTRCDYFLNGSEVAGDLSDDEREVYSCIRTEFSDLGIKCPGYERLVKAKCYKEFKRNVPVFVAFVDEYLKPESKSLRRWAYRLLIRCVLRYRPTYHTAGITYVAQGIGEVGYYVDRAFPGYRTAGLLPMIMNRQL